jgi:hypothetical protein
MINETSADGTAAFESRAAAAIRGRPEGHNGDKRQAYIDYVEASEAMGLSILDLPSTTPSWKMNDAEFRRLLATVKAAREARKKKAA